MVWQDIFQRGNVEISWVKDAKNTLFSLISYFQLPIYPISLMRNIITDHFLGQNFEFFQGKTIILRFMILKSHDVIFKMTNFPCFSPKMQFLREPLVLFRQTIPIYSTPG